MKAGFETIPPLRAPLADLERRLGYFFNRPTLLFRALCHRSYTHENLHLGLRENERLEFLGDAVLELAITSFIHYRYPEMNEGRLTQLRAALVNEQSLAGLSRGLDLGRFILLGKGELASGGEGKPSILSDCLEAVMGAVYLDAGYETAAGLVQRLWSRLLREGPGRPALKDHKTMLQELMQEKNKITPNYRHVRSEGPDHCRTFYVEVRARGEALASGRGRSKKEAEQDAAAKAFENLLNGEDLGGSERVEDGE